MVEHVYIEIIYRFDGPKMFYRWGAPIAMKTSGKVRLQLGRNSGEIRNRQYRIYQTSYNPIPHLSEVIRYHIFFCNINKISDAPHTEVSGFLYCL